MKRVHTLFMCVVLLSQGLLYAQEPSVAFQPNKKAKPLLFASLPDQFECSYSELQKILASEINESFHSQLSGQLFIQGTIVDKTLRNAGSFSINIRIKNYDNALFNISVRLQADNSINIQGRILHPKYGDVLILYKDKDKYYFKKQLQRFFMTE